MAQTGQARGGRSSSGPPAASGSQPHAPGPAGPLAAVPDRPALAPGVRLVGEWQDSGFADRQWLLERGGRFVQVSELLYRIIEQADGSQTCAEIAARVTAATDWLVTPDQVRQLVQRKLLPLGLVALPGAEGAGPPPRAARSPLQLGLRARLLGPRLADPAARALQPLFAPPLLVPALGAIALAHAWLYLVHGGAGGLRDALYLPGRLLLVLPVLLAAAAFHELGHAAALRYGGGRVRGIGAGVYFLFPAFYTDVTDGYRLGRWARVRTDLGGIYFHLLFATGLVALARATGQEALLPAVALIDLEVARQLVPLGRLDGYWALADLTGVPDVFAQLGPLARGGQRPRLRPWAGAVCALYLLATVPVLAGLGVLLVAGLPGLVALVWDAALLQAGTVAEAGRTGDVARLAAPAAQVLVLGLVAVGTGQLLYGLGAGAIGAVWRWGRPTPQRRVVAALAIGGTAGLLALLWTPRLPFARPPAPAGVERFAVPERRHLQGPIAYPQVPPVGGNHAPLWQNCGFYDAPIAAENAVHSLEHGAVWITYRPDLAGEHVAILRQVAARYSHVLASPYPDLPAPAVASAWGVQLQLDSAADPRLEQFVRAFHLGPQAPESGGPCTGGVGQPR